MLPGLRFLLVAIVLSTSMLIFGLGAAALLRTAHEEFANLPTRRAQPEPVFAQPVETTRPTLALLRVDAPPEPPAATPPEQPAPMAAKPEKSAEPDRMAALNTATPSEETPRPADPPAEQAAETPAPSETPARVDIAAAPPETQTATNPQPAAPAAIEATVTASEPAAAPADDGAKAAAMKIATLGGPEVVINPKAAPKTSQATAGKSVQTRHRTKRRRIVRPRIVAPKPVTLGLFEPLPAPDRPIRQN
jgi:hypothetical protein